MWLHNVTLVVPQDELAVLTDLVLQGGSQLNIGDRQLAELRRQLMAAQVNC